MSILHKPIGIREYYQTMIDRNTQKLKDTTEEYDNLIKEHDELRKIVEKDIHYYKDNYNINLLEYREWIEDKYDDGKLINIAKYIYGNRKNGHTLYKENVMLYTYALQLKQLVELKHELDILNKLVKLTGTEYRKILKTYYTEVQRHLVLNGEAYHFDNNLGWICFNRFKAFSQTIDYRKTEIKKQELIANGERIFNKEEADWCKANGIPYDGKDFRVFKEDEYSYQLCIFPNPVDINVNKIKIAPTDYRHGEVRGKSHEELIEMCDNDTDAIMNLDCDVKTKLTLCVAVNKILYTKFIRNEDQKPASYRTFNRKD